jgi:dimethylsulfide dehydrogenase subunit beta
MPTKLELKSCTRQVQMAIDLNKCIGCQACTVGCKSCWTDGPGQENMYWQNVETKPGLGYPRGWENKGGGYDAGGNPVEGRIPSQADYGIPWTYNYAEAQRGGTGADLRPHVEPTWGVNWEEDIGAGDYPRNNHYFYLPKLCVHCTDAPCIDSCPEDAIYKRDEDGIVLISEDLCKGHRDCIKACPYGEIYFNTATKVSQKCIFCFPRVEQGVAPACCKQCVGRCHFVGFADDEESPVGLLVNQWKVALPLKPQHNTQPNVFYVPPILPAAIGQDREFDESTPRVSNEYLETLFGPGVEHALEVLKRERAKRESGEPSALMDLLIAYRFEESFRIPVRATR